MSPDPPVTDAPAAVAALRERGWAVVSAAGLAALTGVAVPMLAPLSSSWTALPPDTWLKDGGKYRSRRHSCFIVAGDDVAPVDHRAHWQSVDYNALHGGLARWFEPMESAVVMSPAWSQLLRGLAAVVSAPTPPARGNDERWFVEAHQFRIDTKLGIGRPTPEGAHRDGVDFVVVILVDRQAIKGGETRVFDALGSAGVRFALTEPWSALLLDDARVMHETTPIQPATPGELGGHRDTLVITFRRGAFQGPGT